MKKTPLIFCLLMLATLAVPIGLASGATVTRNYVYPLGLLTPVSIGATAFAENYTVIMDLSDLENTTAIDALGQIYLTLVDSGGDGIGILYSWCANQTYIISAYNVASEVFNYASAVYTKTVTTAPTQIAIASDGDTVFKIAVDNDIETMSIVGAYSPLTTVHIGIQGDGYDHFDGTFTLLTNYYGKINISVSYIMPMVLTVVGISFMLGAITKLTKKR